MSGHRLVSAAEHDPSQSLFDGACRVCLEPWPCATERALTARPPASSEGEQGRRPPREWLLAGIKGRDGEKVERVVGSAPQLGFYELIRVREVLPEGEQGTADRASIVAAVADALDLADADERVQSGRMNRVDWAITYLDLPDSAWPEGEQDGRSEAARMLAAFEGHANSRPTSLSLELTLHREEHAELQRELELGFDALDRAHLARELADVTYLAYRSAHIHGIDLDAALREIHRAAMDKIEANVRRSDGKILKPPGFVPPDMSSALLPAPPSSTEGGEDA